MRAVAEEIAAGLAFVAIGVAVALGITVPQRVAASPDPGLSYVWRGMMPWAGWLCYPWNQFAGWHPSWHDDEAGDYRAIDYNRGDQTAGSAVYLDYFGSFQLFKIVEYTTGYCTGVRAKIYLGSYDEKNYRGDVHYLHIDPNEYWFDKEVPGQTIWIGDVLAQEDPNCPWTGAHLHQSADVSSATPFYSNKLVDPSQDDEWEHAIFWGDPSGDNDGDGWINKNELYIGTDPLDNCPDNTSDAAWPPDINNDTRCSIADAILFRPHILSSIGEDCYDNRFDLQADGDVDVADVLLLRPYILTSCA